MALPTYHPYKNKPPVVGITLWTPAQLDTEAWYDAADLSTITPGATFTWADKSANGRDLTQGTAGAQPATGSRTLNGLNVLDFDGGDFLTKTSFPIINFSLSVFVVAVIDSIDNAADAIFSTAASKDFSLEAFNASQFDGRILCTDAGNPNVPLSGGPFPGPSIYNALVTTTGFRIRAYVDGVQRADTAYIGGISGSVTFRIFADRAAAAFPNGAVAEVVVMNKATTGQRQLIEGYLAWKWSLVANLPSDHPYKNVAPVV